VPAIQVDGITGTFRYSPGGVGLAAMNTAKSVIADDILRALVKQASEYTGILLDVSPTSSPGDSSGARCVLKDTSSDNSSELTRPLSGTEVYQVLLSMNELFHHIQVIKLKHFQRVEEEKRNKRNEKKGVEV
jgi:hypothetical protein